jgi:hypothetical protein
MANSTDKPQRKPTLYGAQATGMPVLDNMAYGCWPHLFTPLALEYDVPPHFLITLLFLWEATVGADRDAPCGNLALTQIPVRVRESRKWLAAFVAAGFFTVRPAKLGDKTGSFYEYRSATTAKEWEGFFAAVDVIFKFPGDMDKLSPAAFSKLISGAAKADWLTK